MRSNAQSHEPRREHESENVINMSDEGKLHIDDDWKSQAQAEKERLSREVDQADDAGDAGGGAMKADFIGLVNMLAMQAAAGLNGLRDPSTGQSYPPNPELAKIYIDLLDVIEQKTKGNLDEEEKSLLDTAIYQLRMAYVQIMSGDVGAPGGRGGPAGS
jgi:hypothetical protein